MTLRIGIVGCGLIGQKRARAALADGHTVTMAADLDLTRAQALAALTGGRATSTTSWQDVIASDVDAVIVATTHDQIARIGAAAADAGKHILLEKPGARYASELEPVLAAVRRTGVVAKAGFNHRFHPSFMKARALVDAGELGPLLYIRGRYGHGGRVGYEKEWRCAPEISGGGELIDQGSHLIDLSRWFLGNFTKITGFTPTYFWNIPVEDNCFMALGTANGQMAWLHASWSEWKNLFSFEIFGRDGKLQIDGLGGSYGGEKLTFYRMLPQLGPPETTTWEYPFPDRSFEDECREFFAAIAERRAPLGDLNDAKANLDIVAQIYQQNGLSRE